MEAKTLILLMISTIILLVGFAYSFFFPLDNFFSSVPLVLLIIGFFIFGAMLFGYLSFVPHLFFGLAMGATKNATIFIYLLPIIIATYAGIKLGTDLMKDFNKEKYFLKGGRITLILLVSAIVLALIIENALPMIIESGIWPENLLGLDIQQGNSVGDMIDEIRGYIR